MDLSLTPALRDFQDEVRTWLHEHLVGEFAQYKGVGFSWDDQAWDVRLAWDKELSAGGWLCLGWPREYGGRAASVDEQLIFQIEYARANPPYRATIQGQDLLGPTLLAFGSPEQKARFLPRIVAVEELWGQGFSEPGAGSDTSSISTTAVFDDATNEWIINGEKIFCTNGKLALDESNGLVVVWASIDRSAGRAGMRPFVVEAGTPGVKVAKTEIKHGIRASDTAAIVFENARIPADHLLGSAEVVKPGEQPAGGTGVPQLQGAYLFGDLCSGVIWAAFRQGNGFTVRTLTDTLPNLIAFGQDKNGELYVTTSNCDGRGSCPGDKDKILRITR